MVSRYDQLDARTQLEQVTATELDRALGKRGFTVEHQGTETNSALGDRPDIIAENDTVRFNVEVTKTTKASSDREYPAIKDHLEKAKQDRPRKKCFVLYISPETHYRMINNMRDFNILHKDDPDMKMLPLSFASFQLLMDKLIGTTADIYPKRKLITVFDDYKLFVDDARILEVLHDRLFSDDEALQKEIDIQEQEKHQRTVDELIRDLLKLEDNLREEKGVVHLPAIKDIIFLVFVKLYEEKREFDDKENRFKPDTFKKYQEYVSQERTKRAIHILFDDIKNDNDLKAASVFTDTDNLSEKIDDDFVMDFFIKKFEKYHFYTTRVDGIGAAYEILGMRTGKDVKAGQFFTPENVVKFMVRLAELDIDDIVLDPACGTARFLIYAMRDMQKKAESGRDVQTKKDRIAKQQLFGSDYDLNVAKLAKMNMYINGDGKSHIFDRDGLLLYDRPNPDAMWNLDEKVDVILTNPPLGDQSFLKSEYDSDFKFKRMQVIPKRNLTEEKLKEQTERLIDLNLKLGEAQVAQNSRVSKSLAKRIRECQRRIDELKGKLVAGGDHIEWKPMGKQMKGGALFIGASHLYLKPVRNSSEPIEWQGGKLLIILDEGILNTDDYVEVRKSLLKNFYIKAIISLSRDTFKPFSDTSTKTSILYAVKKKDPDALQGEPIFFAHAEKVGVNTKKHVCENHLFDGGNDMLSKYFEFKRAVLNSYVGLQFSPSKFETQGFRMGQITDVEIHRPELEAITTEESSNEPEE